MDITTNDIIAAIQSGVKGEEPVHPYLYLYIGAGGDTFIRSNHEARADRFLVDIKGDNVRFPNSGVSRVVKNWSMLATYATAPITELESGLYRRRYYKISQISMTWT